MRAKARSQNIENSWGKKNTIFNEHSVYNVYLFQREKVGNGDVPHVKV